MAHRPPEPDPVEALYGLPLEEFVEARNRLAAEVAKGGDKARAAAIKTLVKPSLSAWVANQIFWHDRALYDKLAEAVGAARSASGNDLRGALEARRQALVAAGRRAAEILSTAGSPASPDTLRRISNTLEAVTTLDPTPDTQPGRLARDVDPPGFDALAGWTAAAAQRDARPARVLEFKSAPAHPAPASKTESKKADAAHKAALAAARAAVAAAEKALAGAQREAERAERAAAAARKKAEEAESERQDLETRLARTTAASQNAAREARELERAAGAAALALRQAEIELARTQGKVPRE
jgi:hypothetical protein